MSYVIYHKATGELFTYGRTSKSLYDTEAAAKSAVTRIENAISAGTAPRNLIETFKRSDYAVTDAVNWRENLKPKVEYHMVRNLMSGEMVRQAVNTPISCDVSSETYWSM